MIVFCFTAGIFIPHASSSLQTEGGACEHPTAPFARPGVCTSASYRGGNWSEDRKGRTESGAGLESGAGTETVTGSRVGTGTGTEQERERERGGGERRNVGWGRGRERGRGGDGDGDEGGGP